MSDLVSGRETRLSNGTNPILAPDDSLFVYRNPEPPLIGLVQGSLSSTRSELLKPVQAFPTDWSPDGKRLLLMVPQPFRQYDVLLMDLATRQMTPVVHTAASEGTARFSPDGQWIAYVSDESGTTEVFVCPLDDPERRVPVSIGGGVDPQWSGDGRQLYYVTPTGTLMSVGIKRGGEQLTAALPERLFDVLLVSGAFFGGNYAVDRHNERFLVLKPAASPPGNIGVILNWQRALSAPP
jgi:Tol biopolymer transport system component